MSNDLIKDARFTYIPGDPGVPAQAGQPWIPAHTATIQVYQCQLLPQLVSTHTYEPATGHWFNAPGGYVVAPNGERFIWQNNVVCGYVDQQVQIAEQPYRPAVAGRPATPSQTIIDYNIGWNAGAHSIAQLGAYDFATFSVDQTTVGAAVGYSVADTSAGYEELLYAWVFTNGIAKIMEAGAVVATSGAFVSTDRFDILRLGSKVLYRKNGAVVHTTTGATTVALYLDTSLYSAGDAVRSPAIGHSASAEMSILPLTMFGAEGAKADAIMVMEPLTMRGESYGRGTAAMSILPLTMTASNKSYGAATMSILPLTMDASSGFLIPTFSKASMSMPPLAIGALGLTGTIGGAHMSSLPLRLSAADHAYGDARMTMELPTLAASAYEGNLRATMGSTLMLNTDLSAETLLLAVMDSSGTLTGVIGVGLHLPISMRSVGTLHSNLTPKAIFNALMESSGTLVGITPDTGDSYEVWVLNADTKASSRYENFPMNSFAYYDGAYLGGASDGLCLLDGDTDAGSHIQAMIDLGALNFGTLELKRVLHAYLGVVSETHMLVKLIVDGQEYLYSARKQSDNLRTQRVDLGRGLKASYFSLQVYNQAGGDFDLAKIEFVPIPVGRRI